MSRWSRPALLAGVVLVWSAVAVLGFHAMFAHATEAGEVADSPERWPAGTRLSRGSGVTIAMFVHPDCPCSRASLSELAAVARISSVTLDIVIAGPDAGGIWDDAGRIAGAVRIVDDGREAARFGALTSGYTVVYDRAGRRRFAGGITGSRGHVGDNVGRDTVQRIVDGLDPQVRSHSVFGCALGGGR
jgi:hypothetical protein